MKIELLIFENDRKSRPEYSNYNADLPVKDKAGKLQWKN